MSSRSLTRKSKAIALVPLALLSGAWTASLAGVGTVASAAGTDSSNAAGQAASLPGGESIPSEAIQAPASVPVPGIVAPSVPDGSADSVVAGASTSGIPAPALSAYQRGAQIINAADKTCNIPWELIAAIGRVESDHGRYGGNTLTSAGVSKPGIYGIALNGKNGTQAIRDTDAGELDRDRVYDRAVGAMQFIPSTWQVVKVDADADGQRNPQDIDDSSLATAVYLCSGPDNLSNRAGQEKAVYRYNHSQDYVNLVLRIMEAYSAGDYTSVPAGTSGGSVFSPSYASVIQQARTKAAVRVRTPRAARKRAQQQSSSSGGVISSGGTSSGSGTVEQVTPSAPSSGGSSPDPVQQATEPATKATDKVVQQAPAPVKEPVTKVTQAPAPVVATLSASAARALCASRLTGAKAALVGTCAAQATGKTESQANAIIAALLG